MQTIREIEPVVVDANFHWTYERIYSYAASGLYGTGECYYAPGLVRMLEACAELLV
ncbi:MAG: hypothetical protein ACKVP1_10460 [Burkholderiaceae bacterium]